MKYFVQRFKRFCGYITGFVFFMGGMTKLLDPVGAGLVMDSYFDFLHIGFLSPVSKITGTLFALAEAIVGVGLITGVWRKISGIVALVMQIFFTLLTVLLVIFQPDMDCGCFGEVLELSHWETFWKNIVLLVLLLSYALPLKHIGKPKNKKYVSFGLVTLSVILFSLYSYMYIPLVDHTEYKPSAQIQAAQSDEQEDMYEAAFVYEKDGIREVFDLEHLPDSTWTFVETQTKMREDVVEKVPLSITDAAGQYCDEIAADGRVMVVSIYDADKGAAFWKSISEHLGYARQAGFRPVILVSSPLSELALKLGEAGDTDIMKWVYFSDYKTLITLNRSNGGFTYLNDGTIIRKWARRAAPDLDGFNKVYDSDDLETEIDNTTAGSLTYQGFLLYVFAIMLLL